MMIYDPLKVILFMFKVFMQGSFFPYEYVIVPTPFSFLHQISLAHLEKKIIWPHLYSLLWRRKQQPTPVFMPGKSHGPRSLVGYNPWGRKESDMTE